MSSPLMLSFIITVKRLCGTERNYYFPYSNVKVVFFLLFSSMVML